VKALVGRLTGDIQDDVIGGPDDLQDLIGVALELRWADAGDRGQVGPVRALPPGDFGEVRSWNTT
jgi:hypothetical protein